MNNKLNYTLCFDQDDTVLPTTPSLIDFFNKKTNLNIVSGHHDDFGKLFNISQEQLYAYFIEFAEKDILKNIKPFDGMFQLFIEMKKLGCSIKIITARPRPVYERQTWNYLQKFFPNIFKFEDLLMHDERDELIVKVDKIKMMKEVNGDMFIDDSPSKVIEMFNAFPEKLILFKEHSTHPVIDICTLPKGIIPVKNAADIRKEILEYHTRNIKN